MSMLASEVRTVEMEDLLEVVVSVGMLEMALESIVARLREPICSDVGRRSIAPTVLSAFGAGWVFGSSESAANCCWRLDSSMSLSHLSNGPEVIRDWETMLKVSQSNGARNNGTAVYKDVRRVLRSSVSGGAD